MLTFVPTPIGNLGDITLRAIETLKEADLIACEDTRHSLKLLKRLEISKPLTALHDHNEDRRIPELLEKAKAGEKIAIISDAGTPCLSDPGHRLLKAARDAGVPFTVLPGPSAITTALVASGFPPHPFSFHGFLAVKKGKRGKQLQAALDSTETTLFFESPHRIPSTLEILAKLSPGARVCVARELTKKFETLHHGTTTELFAHFSERKAKGEIVLIIPPANKKAHQAKLM
ncbi:MAG: 16S rRNA (cytidine(1402)-2'-O)-methyltransferase [Akkermansiaceae bacterium]|jgi:16S rRNA (cytidine1402-2'-O)-methyltransferase|nr:16S rRNA (cytidine(1402)-2'-O)-methyltransferase [Akkermansiaceae bacterium]